MAKAKKKKIIKKPEEPLKLNMSFDEAVELTLNPEFPTKSKKKKTK